MGSYIMVSIINFKSRIFTRHSSLVTRHLSLVIRHLSPVTCHLSLIACHLLLSLCTLTAQEAGRPPVWGIAKMTFLVSDMDMARDYYGRFLGFDEAFSYPSPLGMVVSFKVSDRQFLEFIVDKDARSKKRLVSISFETDAVDRMRDYLIAQKVRDVGKTTIDGAGNEVFTVDDNWGNTVEFIRFNDNGLHKLSKGKFLSENRISKRIHHAGLYSEKIDEQDPFWVGALKCRELVRYPEDKTQAPVILYLGMGNSTENIELYTPNDPNFGHPCFAVDDMQDTVYTLKERAQGQRLSAPSIGRGKRWLLNLSNPDNTKVEFTELHTVK